MKKGDLVRMNTTYHTDVCGIVLDADNENKVIRVLFINPNIFGARLQAGAWRRQEIFEVINEAK